MASTYAHRQRCGAAKRCAGAQMVPAKKCKHLNSMERLADGGFFANPSPAAPVRGGGAGIKPLSTELSTASVDNPETLRHSHG
jgi:hypothetical protein